MVKGGLFRKVSTSKSGIDDITLSYGAAWGDFNGDGFLDLYANNHQQPSSLYLNQKDGTFLNITDKVFTKKPEGDEHGTAWADFDNDGDQDLIVAVGAARGVGIGPFYKNRLYVNEGGKLVERSVTLGVADPLARARGVLWLDYNKDGRLDLIVGAEPRNDKIVSLPKLFLQNTDGTFTNSSKAAGFRFDNAEFFAFSDLSGDGNLDVIIDGQSIEVLDPIPLPFKNITSTILPNSNQSGVNDIISADFNGDLKADLFLAENNVENNELFRKDSDSLIARLAAQESEKGIKFTTDDKVNFNIFNLNGSSSVPLDRIYIGKTGKTIEDFGFDFNNSRRLNFTLSPDNPDVRGIYPHDSGKDLGIYIGYNASSQSWQLRLSSNANGQTIPKGNSLLAFIDAVAPISQTNRIGFTSEVAPSNSKLLLSSNSGLRDRTLQSGIDTILAQAKSAVAGDFDNDMDEDLFIVTSTEIGNTADILYKNQGDGTFVAVPNAGGAQGLRLGVGDFVTTADYDLDGFLDLFIGNSDVIVPSPLTENPAYALFQNQGNNNHWLEIDLRGIVSNRDGIGAQIFLTADGVTQMRQQDSGIHYSVQDSQRIHFGLGKNTQIDKLVVKWPSGREQTITDIPADRLIEVVEKLGDVNNNFSGGQKNNVINGGNGNDTLNGNKGKDILIGKSGNDVLIGGADDDILIGNRGVDTMIGGTGADIFRFDSFREGRDRIEDFAIAKDTIQVSAAGFGGRLVGDRAITKEQLRIGAIATNTEQRFIYNPVNGALSFDRDGSDSVFDRVQLAILSGGLAITNKDIFVLG